MDSESSFNSLKPNLSKLFLRTLEQLEDPKYATVPQTHFDELRPSILAKYAFEDESHDSSGALKVESKSSKFDICKECQQSTTKQRLSSRSSQKPPMTFRSMNWKIQPLWRYCASALQLPLHNGASKQAFSMGKTKRKASKAETEKLSMCSSAKTVTNLQHSPEEQLKTKWRSHSSEHLQTIQSSLSAQKLRTQCSVPAFELLPPLFENCTHSLLYQNSYLLDGVKYDYETTKSQQQQQQRCVRTKLRLNYMRFLKSVNKKLNKPSDCDIVFGEAKVVPNPPLRWEGARINWLIDLERKQEMRKLQLLEQEKQMHENRQKIDLARKESMKSHKILKKNTKNRPNVRPTGGEMIADEKRKCFFIKKFRKTSNLVKQKTTKNE